MTDAHLHSEFGLRILKPRHPLIRRLKRQYPSAGLHGNKLWKASYLMMDYLSESPLQEGSRILEIGAGWGLAGIFCARQFGAEVVALDADESVFPFLECHAQHNDVCIDTIEMDFADIQADDLQQFDAIIGADICFWDSLTPVVIDLIRKALEAEVPRLLLTDPGRPSFRQVGEHFAGSEGIEASYTDWAVPEPHNIWGLVLDITHS